MYKRVCEGTNEKETKQNLKKCHFHYEINHAVQKGQTLHMRLVDRCLPITNLAYSMTLLNV